MNTENTPGQEPIMKEEFRTILLQHLQLDSTLLADLVAKKVLTKDEVEEIEQANIGNAAKVCLLFEKLAPSSDMEFVKCLENSDGTSNKLLASYILDKQPIPALSDQHLRFCRVFESKLPELVSKLTPSEMLDKLYTHLGQEVTERIETIEDKSSRSKAALHLCFSLLRCASDWPSTFVTVLENDCYDVSIFEELKTNLPIRDSQQPATSVQSSCERDSDSFTSTQSFQDGYHEEMSPGDMHAASLREREVASETNQEESKCRAANASRLVGATSSGTSGSDTAKEFSSDFHHSLWKFQRKIAEPALNKLNTLLVSPTGTGKTHVAAYIIDQHLKELETERVRGRVVFIVPTVRLAKQQQTKLTELIGSETRIIASVVGDDINVNCSLLSKMSAENVFVTVMTPQVFVNGMKKTSPLETVHLEDVTLLVLDECHHTTKDHPYNSIMRVYLQKKMCSDWGDKRLPQVLGMTANPGTGGSSSDEQALNHIFQVAASLDASVIQPVEVDEDLMKYLNIPEDIGPIILRPRRKDPFRNALENLMKKIEEKIASLFVFPAGSTFNGKTVKPMSQRDTQNYETWIAEFKKQCTESRSDMSEEQHQTVIICLENLKIYNKALCIHRDVRPKDAVRYLEREIKELRLRTGQCYEELVKLFEDSFSELQLSSSETEENPLLKKMKEMFVSTYMVNPDSRTILFTRTRAYTKALQEWLQEDEEIQKLNLNPGRIIGSQGPEISKSEGDETIHKFRMGEHKLVVSTNVLEEGFDLKECNLVIRHNYVPSETGHTQVKGRGRAKGSKSFLVALTDTGRDFMDQEMNNKTREQLSEHLLQRISNMLPQEVEQRIQEQQEQLWPSIFPRQQIHEPLNKADPQEFCFVCSKCPQEVCSCADIVCFRDSKYIVTDSRITDRCKIEKKSRPFMVKLNEFMNGKILCKGCGHHWGSWCTINGDNYPMIKLKQLSIQNTKTRQFLPPLKKPKDINKLFPIRNVKTIELNFDIADATDVDD